MTGIDVLLIVIGAILVIVSFVISEKVSGHASETANGMEIWSDRDEEAIKDRINIVLSGRSEQIVNDTDDRLCHLSNEKIMEFQEFADQINEKLNENHNQSVFLYKMLTEKQSEMKEWIAELDSKYAGIKDEFNSIDEMVNMDKFPDLADMVIDKKYSFDSDAKNLKTAGFNIKSDTADEYSAKKEEMKDENKVNIFVDKNDSNSLQTSSMPNKNEKILELFNSGKSLIEISKQLGIGQGEVKLVVDLYRGNKI